MRLKFGRQPFSKPTLKLHEQQKIKENKGEEEEEESGGIKI